MQGKSFRELSGYVRLKVKGRKFEEFVNAMTAANFSVWDVQILGDGHLAMAIAVRDFFRLRPLLKRTGCRMHIVSRHGLPFFLDKLGRRKMFAVGLIGFVIGLYMLSSIVWQVKVEGTEKLSAAQVLQAAHEVGIRPYQWKVKLKPTDALARAVQAKLPGTAWVGVEIRGTQVVVRVVESSPPEKTPLANPRSLVAAKSAVITEIKAVKGRPLVKPNMYVRKGDVLISGIIGDESNGKTVVAEGEVKGIVWYTSNIEVPLTRVYKVYTGESFRRFYLVFGTRALQVTGYGKNMYPVYETSDERKTLQWHKYGLPIGWLTETVREVRHDEKKLDEAEAAQIGLEHARADLYVKAGRGSRITEENVLQRRVENGKVYMNVQYGVEEPIAVEQPIISR